MSKSDSGSAASHLWTRPVPVKWLDSWYERLAFIDPTRLTAVEKPGCATARLQVYPPDLSTGKKLVRHFGGTLRVVPQKEWLINSQQRIEIRIGTRLIIATDHDQTVQLQIRYPRRTVLQMPAGLAFGTGDHPTTAMIIAAIAELTDLSSRNVLDIGTGSGILALACRACGSPKIEAFDYDPVSIRTAKTNEKLNFPQAKIKWTTQDLHDWRPEKRYELITANLFLETLVNHASRIVRALAPGGILFTSGLLSSQQNEAEKCFLKTGLKRVRSQKRGKWVMQTWKKE